MYEGDIWTYSLYAPQDMKRLIEMAGGDKRFNDRLDFIFYARTLRHRKRTRLPDASAL